MKKIIIAGSFLMLALGANAQTTIYTGDGTLSSNRIVNLNTRTLQFKGTSSSGLFFNAFGSVGINTLNPSELFEVNGNIKGIKGIFTNSQATQTFSSYDDRSAKCGVINGGTLLSAASGSRTFNFYDYPQSSFNPQGNTVFLSIEDRAYKTRMSFTGVQGSESTFVLYDKNQAINFRIYEDGIGNGKTTIVMPKVESYLGIGTTVFTDGVDTFKLSVNGNIRAHRVKVYTTWADYVFEDNYKLPTLEEVEKHIEEKGHLIDIPSAAEVEANGIELGEMNKLLLQKIEELTLYTIELNKQVQDLKGQINKQ